MLSSSLRVPGSRGFRDLVFSIGGSFWLGRFGPGVRSLQGLRFEVSLLEVCGWVLML